MTRLLAVLMLFAVHTTAWAQAVAPRPAPVLPPPAYTPGYAPGTPAEPVYTPQGAGAYRGDPLPTAPVPRSPNKRILPREKDGAPGLWAADGAPPTPNLFDVALPYPPYARSAEAKTPTESCAKSLHEAAVEADVLDAILRFPPEIRRCLAARAYLRCIDGTINYLEARKAVAPDYYAAALPHALGARSVALAMRQAECRDVVVSPEHRDAVDSMFALWSAGLTVIKDMHR